MKKKFTDILNEMQYYSVGIDGKRKNNTFDKMNLHHSSLQQSLGFNNVVDVNDAFHNKYKNSGDYVSATGKKDDRSNKQIRQLMSLGQKMEYPNVEVAEDGKITFQDGRHRYGMLTRLKQLKQVAMSNTSMANSKLNGYI